jgi:hypothetical protein
VFAFVPSGALAQPPAQDTVSLPQTPADVSGPANFHVVSLSATSGPSGENPAGRVTFTAFFGLNLDGPVTCLAVRGNTATINFQDQIGGFGITTVQVVDNQPDSFDAEPRGRTPGDCSPLPFTALGGPLIRGDISVADAPPLPTSKDQCRNGGWRTFGIFKNQGACVSFVATGGKNPPGRKAG